MQGSSSSLVCLFVCWPFVLLLVVVVVAAAVVVVVVVDG